MVTSSQVLSGRLGRKSVKMKQKKFHCWCEKNWNDDIAVDGDDAVDVVVDTESVTKFWQENSLPVSPVTPFSFTSSLSLSHFLSHIHTHTLSRGFSLFVSRH